VQLAAEEIGSISGCNPGLDGSFTAATATTTTSSRSSRPTSWYGGCPGKAGQHGQGQPAILGGIQHHVYTTSGDVIGN
jgi:hypothetical protein